MPDWIETEDGYINASMVQRVTLDDTATGYLLYDKDNRRLGYTERWNPMPDRQVIPCPPGWKLIRYWPAEDDQPEGGNSQPVLGWIVTAKGLKALTIEGPGLADDPTEYGETFPRTVTGLRDPDGMYYLIDAGFETQGFNTEHAFRQHAKRAMTERRAKDAAEKERQIQEKAAKAGAA